MPIPKDYEDIITTLSTATDEGRVKWTAERFGMKVSVSGSRFIIWSGTDEESDSPFVSFGLSDENGNSLDTWYVDQGDAHFECMQRLFSGAKRQALGIPQRLASIREEMNKSKIIGDTTPKMDDGIPF